MKRILLISLLLLSGTAALRLDSQAQRARHKTQSGSAGFVAAKTQAVAAGQPATSTAQAPANIKESKGAFKSESKDISFEHFEPVGTGRYPTIVMLYGSGGMDVGGPLFRETARALALQGYIVYLPFYFEKTETRRAAGEDYVKYFAPWMRAINDLIVYAKEQPNVDSKRIGLIGFSLGAYLSLSVASVNNEIKAVAEYFGGLPDIFGKQIQTLPPILILHGEADKAVPVAEAYKLETLLKSKNSPYEIKIYPDQGHGFTGPAAGDALQRTFAFFAKNLKAAKPELLGARASRPPRARSREFDSRYSKA
jgi:carboxymethylenebutenolidase